MKRWLALLLSAGMLLALCGCQPENPATEPDDDGTSSTTTTTVTTTTTTKPAPVRYYNFLTGENSLTTNTASRPVAVMICNDSKARPQKGIAQADLYIESETEAGISRIMAVFAHNSTIPDELGAVRSARTHYVKMADALDAIIVHAGGSVLAKELINSSAMPDMDYCGADSKAFWRDPTLRKTKGYDHSLITGHDKLVERINKKNYRKNTTAKAPFLFGAKTGSAAATTLDVKLSASQNISFQYDEASGTYLKFNGKTGSSKQKAHTDEDGTQIATANVIVMLANRYNEDATHVTFTLDSGKGFLFTGGTAREIGWKRTDSQLSFTEQNGDALAVATGKTYICLISDSYRKNVVYS